MPHTLLYFLALFSLSTSPNWAKLNQMPVEVLGTLRLGIAAALLGLWILYRKHRLPKISKSFIWVLLSGSFFFLHLWTYKYAAKTTSVSNTMILFSSNPVWASLGSIIFFGERLKLRLIISYLLALVAIYLLVAHDFVFDPRTIYGDWSALLSAFFYAAYMVTGKKARHHYDNTIYAFFQYGICSLLFLLCVTQTGASFSGYSAISWYAVAGLVLMPTFIGHFTLTYLVKHMDLSILTCGKLIEPIIASILAYYIFRETLSPNAWISFLLTAMAVLVLFSPSLLKYFKKLYLPRTPGAN